MCPVQESAWPAPLSPFCGHGSARLQQMGQRGCRIWLARPYFLLSPPSHVLPSSWPVVPGLHTDHQLQPLHPEAVPALGHHLCQRPHHRSQQQ
jgi:hypothetical protein